MNKPSSTNKPAVTALLLSTALLTACGTAPRRDMNTLDPSQTTAEATPDLYYTVERGDLLSGIARELTGAASNWETIAEANGISDPRKLRVGQQIVVPGYLLPPITNDTSAASVPTAVAMRSVERRRPSVMTKPTVDDVGPDTADVVITKANPNKRFVLTPLGEKSEESYTELTGSEYIKVVGSYFPKVVYRSPQLDAKLLMRVAPGTTFPLEKLDDGWYRVNTDQGIGFLRVEDGEPTNSDG